MKRFRGHLARTKYLIMCVLEPNKSNVSFSPLSALSKHIWFTPRADNLSIRLSVTPILRANSSKSVFDGCLFFFEVYKDRIGFFNHVDAVCR